MLMDTKHNIIELKLTSTTCTIRPYFRGFIGRGLTTSDEGCVVAIMIRKVRLIEKVDNHGGFGQGNIPIHTTTTHDTNRNQNLNTKLTQTQRANNQVYI